jgi:hypothetical protein
MYHYLKDRNTSVQVGKYLSEMKLLDRGVPQGAVLSPTLFNIMLSDLQKSPQVKILSYADDITSQHIMNFSWCPKYISYYFCGD